RELVEKGGRAVIVDTNEERGNALTAELGPDKARFVRADVTSEDDIGRAIEAARELGALRVAVNCAGVGWAARVVGRDGKPHDLDLFKKVITVNLIGTFNVIRLAAAAMSASEPVNGER